MNDTNRQAYVFLEEGDVIFETDEYYSESQSKWVKDCDAVGGPCFGERFSTKEHKTYRRAIQPPSIQSDKPTVWDMYAIEVLKVMILDSEAHIPTLVNGVKNITDAIMKARPQ